jgi:hypothetical protein
MMVYRQIISQFGVHFPKFQTFRHDKLSFRGASMLEGGVGGDAVYLVAGVLGVLKVTVEMGIEPNCCQ